MAAPRPELYLAAAAAARIRREIRKTHGNEVCFLAGIGEDGAILDPHPVARGHATAVLAAIRDPVPGGVVLHNHPSGVLEPSAADLAVAGRLWEQGLGFAIVDNDAEALYIVVEPPPEQRHELLDLEAMDAELAPGGAVARHHPAYEDRPQQRAFARLVAELYNDGGVGIAEAGTGTGKSIAYLLPAIRWALRNRERTVVSTNTINLQEQLVEKDLPFLMRAIGEPFKYALVKGRQNYVSIRRARLALESAQDLFGGERDAELAQIREWLGKTRDGSLSDLPFRPSPEVWDEVVSDTDVCLRARCPHFQDCFFQQARREVAAADVVVVNHHLLFADLAVRHAQGNYAERAVLPAYRRLVLDEAHNLEESATSHLGTALSRAGVYRLLSRIENRGKGLLAVLGGVLRKSRHDLISASALELIEQRLRPDVETARTRAGEVFAQLETVVADASGMVRLEDSFRDHPVWRQGLSESLEALLVLLGSLQRGLKELRNRVGIDEASRAEHEAQLLELGGVINRLGGVQQGLEIALRPGADVAPMIRWLEKREREGRGGNLRVAAVPLDLAGLIRESLLEKVPTVVLTSATLATGGDFRFLRERLGLRPDDAVREAIFPSPFDFARQAVLAVPSDVPLPGSRPHDDVTARVAIELARVTDGGLFVLFTSYRSLNHVAAELRRHGADGSWPLFVQGEAARARLIRDFEASGRAILLGTTSFWEGVDVPGRPLRALLIPKLPFKVPSEPVTAARIEAIEATGGDAFNSYMLPHAAIRLKQGFGRLIRSRADRGAVVVMDPRIARKGYGRYLVASLPPAPVRVAPWSQLRAALRQFYDGVDFDADFAES